MTKKSMEKIAGVNRSLRTVLRGYEFTQTEAKAVADLFVVDLLFRIRVKEVKRPKAVKKARKP